MKLFSLAAATVVLGCSLFASAPAAAAPPESEKTEQAAREVVERYYTEIDHGHYEAAFHLWFNDGAASGKNLSEFTAGFAQTAQTSVVAGTPTNAEGTAGTLHVTIPVQVTAVLKDGKRQHFAGTYTLRRTNDVDGSTLEDRRWHIESASLHATE